MIAFSGYAFIIASRIITNTEQEQLAMACASCFPQVSRLTAETGLFLGCGTSLAVAGPGGAVLAYLIMGSVIASVISCLCEMTALMPVNAPAMEFPKRFLDRGVGFAVGWMYW